MKRVMDKAIEAIARARAPKEPPVPAGPKIASSGVLERPTCPLCKNTRARPVVSGEDTWVKDRPPVPGAPKRYLVVRCEICGHRYTTPRYAFEHRKEAFEGAYPFYARARAAKGEDLSALRAKLEADRPPFMGRVEGLSSARPYPGRLLDVGCGDGVFMDLMRERGWAVQGLDISEDVVWHAKEVLGLECAVADVEQDDLPPGPFDAITMWGVLQLVYDPRALLDRLRDRLEPDGVIGIGVSNIRSTGARLFGGRWRGLGLPRHISHFTPETLARLLEWAGYEVVGRRFETPKWVIAGSVDDALPAPRPVRMAAKAGLYASGRAIGRTRWADTMEVYAKKR